MTRLFNFMAMAGLMVLLMAGTARAGDIVMSIEGGMTFGGDSGLADVGPLQRDEIATGFALAASAGYQFPLSGGRLRTTLGIDYLGNTDGDWGYQFPNKAIIRQEVDVNSIGGVLAAEYDIQQATVMGFYPFVGGGLRVQRNEIAHQNVELSLGGHRLDCAGDDTSNLAFGWHALWGIAHDFGAWNARVFYQYTDRGTAETADRYSCAFKYNGETKATGTVRATPEDIDIISHEVRVRVSYAF